MHMSVRSISVAAIGMAALLAGCDDQRTKPAAGAPASQAGSTTGSAAVTPATQQVVILKTNELFFGGKPPAVGEPLDISVPQLRGTWQLRTPTGALSLRLSDPNGTAQTLDATGQIATNPDGAATLTLTGLAGGLTSASIPWGIDAPQQRGWLAENGTPPLKPLAEFRLVRDDLLHVKGRLAFSGTGIDVDALFCKAPDGNPWNDYGLHRLTGLTGNELVKESAADPAIKVDSPSAFHGDWVATQEDAKVTLHIADHRVLTARREGGPAVKLTTQEAPREWFYIVDYDPPESALRIKEHEATIKLTKGGRLLYRHFGGQGPGGEGGRFIDVLFTKAPPAAAHKVDWSRFGEFVISGPKFITRRKDGNREQLIGGLYVPNKGPLIGFGLVREPGKPYQYSYLLIVKPPPGERGGFPSESRSTESDDGLQSDQLHKLKIGKHDLPVIYHATLDPTTRLLATESLHVAGGEIKEGQPRLLLIDASGDKLTVKPVNVALPADAPDMDKEETDVGNIGVMKTLLNAVESLKKSSPEVREFLK